MAPELTPFERSVQRQLDRFKQTEAWHIGGNSPKWVADLLTRLRNVVPSQHPVEVLAVTGVSIQADLAWSRYRVSVAMLVQRGWSVEMSLLTFKNFRFAFPMEQLKPEMYALLSRKQLCDSYGDTFGNLIADICIDPDCQPVFARLLRGQMDNTEIVRPTMHVAVAVDIDECVLQLNGGSFPRGFNLSTLLADIGSPARMAGGPPCTLPYTEAARLYHEATGGCEADFTFSLNPQEVDYEALAASGQEVRKIDGLE